MRQHLVHQDRWSAVAVDHPGRAAEKQARPPIVRVVTINARVDADEAATTGIRLRRPWGRVVILDHIDVDVGRLVQICVVEVLRALQCHLLTAVAQATGVSAEDLDAGWHVVGGAEDRRRGRRDECDLARGEHWLGTGDDVVDAFDAPVVARSGRIVERHRSARDVLDLDELVHSAEPRSVRVVHDLSDHHRSDVRRRVRRAQRGRRCRELLCSSRIDIAAESVAVTRCQEVQAIDVAGQVARAVRRVEKHALALGTEADGEAVHAVLQNQVTTRRHHRPGRHRALLRVVQVV